MYKRIMIPLDGSKLAECVIPHAEAFLKNGLVEMATFIRVLEPMPVTTSAFVANAQYMEKLITEAKRAAMEYLEGVASRFTQYGTKIKTEVLEGQVADTLATYAENNNIDLILIATHGRSGIGRWVVGSVADRILRSSLVPVFMVHAATGHGQKKP